MALQDRIARLEADVEALTTTPGKPYTAQEPDENALGGFARESATSRQAALDVYPRSGKQRHRVLLAIAHAGQRGITRDEVSITLGLAINSATARTTELVQGGWVRPDVDGRTRKTRNGSKAAVLVLTDKGYRAVTAEGHAVQEPPPLTPVPPELQGSLDAS